MGWLGALFARLSGEAPPVAAVPHAELGLIQPSHRPRNGLWLWETLRPIQHARGPVSVTWLADESGPTEAQVAFWRWLKDHIDAIVEEARPLLAIDVQDWTENPMPADPWQELFWEGAGLPLDGDRTNEWDVSFATRTCPDVMLTVNYEGGRPVYVTADD